MGTLASKFYLGTSYLTLLYRASPKDNAGIQKQVQELLETKLIKESCSSYSPQVTFVYKKGECKTRLCGD